MEQSLATQEASCTDVFVKVCSQLVNKGWNLLAAMIFTYISFMLRKNKSLRSARAEHDPAGPGFVGRDFNAESRRLVVRRFQVRVQGRVEGFFDLESVEPGPKIFGVGMDPADKKLERKPFFVVFRLCLTKQSITTLVQIQSTS